tara:strand:- start:1188 stop:1400 length:213 start_codon:yes stop_codon:yes gene_type:complete
MMGKNKNNAINIFVKKSKLKFTATVFVKKIIPKPTKKVCNTTTEFKVLNIDCIISIIKGYRGGIFGPLFR